MRRHKTYRRVAVTLLKIWSNGESLQSHRLAVTIRPWNIKVISEQTNLAGWTDSSHKPNRWTGIVKSDICDQIVFNPPWCIANEIVSDDFTQFPSFGRVLFHCWLVSFDRFAQFLRWFARFSVRSHQSLMTFYPTAKLINQSEEKRWDKWSMSPLDCVYLRDSVVLMG